MSGVPQLHIARRVVADDYGLTVAELTRALEWTRTCKTAAEGRREAQARHAQKLRERTEPLIAANSHEGPRTWCAQCERLVLTAEADSCRSQWCKAREMAA